MSAYHDHRQSHNDRAHGSAGIAVALVMDAGVGRTTLEMERVPNTCQTWDPSTSADDRSLMATNGKKG